MNKRDHLGKDTKVEILQANFEHYYRMAMDHHTKATTTSNILIVIVGALLVIIGLDDKFTNSPEDIVSTIILILIGLIGAVWTWKQHERYLHWERYSYLYHKDLKNLMPEFKTKKEYDSKVREYLAKDQHIPARLSDFKDSYLWIFLHIIIMLMGTTILIVSLSNGT